MMLAIAQQFAAQRGDTLPELPTIALHRSQALRYGENPGQNAAFWRRSTCIGLGALKQLGGKELSFNNLLDLEGALLATDPFATNPFGAEPCCAIIKHTTPAASQRLRSTRIAALAYDPVSAFGSVICFSVPVDDATADEISKLFVECIVAPPSEGAVEILGRKKNLRVLQGLLVG